MISKVRYIGDVDWGLVNHEHGFREVCFEARAPEQLNQHREGVVEPLVTDSANEAIVGIEEGEYF
jgi:hypothetical protein